MHGVHSSVSSQGKSRKLTPRADVGAQDHRVFLGVQILRGFAALLVLLQHNSSVMAERLLDPSLKIGFGQSGVDIFFAISGFVMVLVTADSWGRSGAAGPFLIRRLIRVVPLYWLFTTLKILLILAIPTLALSTVLTPWHVTASYLFIPDNFPEPVVQVGWTLCYEMMFYLLFAGLLFMRLRPVMWLSGLLTLLVIAGLFRTEAWGPLTKLMSPLLIEFVFGMLIGLATVQKRILPVRYAPWLAVLAVAAILLSERLGAEANTLRLFVWGIPGALLLASVISLEGWLRARPIKRLVQLGESSYSLYLLHGFIVGITWSAAAKINLGHGLSSYVVYVSTLCICIVAAYIVHRSIELPLTRALSRGYTRIANLAPASPRAMAAPASI